MSTPTLISSKAQVGRGAQFFIGSQTGMAANPEVWTKVSEAVSIMRSGLKRSTIKTTSLDSGEYDTFLSTQIDGGTWTVMPNRIPTDAGYTAIIAAMNTTGGPSFDFKVVFPIDVAAGQSTAGDVYTFSGIINEADGFELATDKAVQHKIVIQQTGPSTYAEGN